MMVPITETNQKKGCFAVPMRSVYYAFGLAGVRTPRPRACRRDCWRLGRPRREVLRAAAFDASQGRIPGFITRRYLRGQYTAGKRCFQAWVVSVNLRFGHACFG